MSEHEIGTVDEFEDGAKKLVSVSGVEIGVFRFDDDFHAWRNVCPHQGGPVCQGRLFKRVIDCLDDDRRAHGRTYDESSLHIVCPWHGAEFDIRTGAHAGLPDLRLTPVAVAVRDGKVFVRVE